MNGDFIDYVAALVVIWSVALIRSLAIAAVFGNRSIRGRDWSGALGVARCDGAVFAAIAIWLLGSAIIGPLAVAGLL
ncbi:hypothetical protein ACXIUS_20190 [Bosea thiooxidans]